MREITWTNTRLAFMLAGILDDQRPVLWIGGLAGSGVGLFAAGFALAGRLEVLREIGLHAKPFLFVFLAGAGLILVGRVIDALRAGVATRTITVTDEKIAVGRDQAFRWSEVHSVSVAKMLRWNLVVIRQGPGRRTVIVPADRLRDIAALLPHQG